MPRLDAAIQAADSNSDAVNYIILAPRDYSLSNQVVVAPPNKALTIVGQGTGIRLTANGQGRALEIDAHVVLENLTIIRGKVTGSPGNPARGGALLIDGGQVTLSHVVVQSNIVSGSTGYRGATGAAGQPGADGGAGGDAAGGGIYMASGSLTLVNSTVTNN